MFKNSKNMVSISSLEKNLEAVIQRRSVKIAKFAGKSLI